MADDSMQPSFHSNGPMANQTNNQYNNIAGNNNQGSQVGSNQGQINNYFLGPMNSDERDCLQALFPPGIKYTDQKNQNPPRIPGTCLWALNHPHYLEWRDSASKTQLLWISADAGCGKSVLSRCIIDEDLKDLMNGRGLIIYYFFKDTSDQRSATKALSSLLHQIFEFKPELIRFALPKYHTRGKEFTNSLADLWSIFVETVTAKEMDMELVCVLDALDECETEDCQRLTSLINEFQKKWKPDSRQQVKFLLTSRPYLKIKSMFSPLKRAGLSIELDGTDESDEIKREIDLVIRYKVQELDLTAETAYHLQERLLEMKQRTYLWLRLILDLIRDSWPDTVDEIDEVIRNLPEGVSKTYERLLGQCTDPALAKRILQIVLVAGRPLSVDEMNVALHINLKTTSITQLKLTSSSRLKETLPGKCGHMISIIDSRIYYVHQTVKEFLVGHNVLSSGSNGSSWQHSLDATVAHRLIGRACLQMLSVHGIDHEVDILQNALLPVDWRILDIITPDSDLYRLPFEPFLLYALTYWADHYRDGHMDEPLKKGFIDPENVVIDRFAFSRKILDAAAMGGHVHVVKLLLAKGATGIDSALEEAAAFGHQEIVQLLLTQGCIDYDYSIAGAARNGHLGIVQLLLDKGVTDYDNALVEAARQGHQEIVQLLLDKGATDIDNATEEAAAFGHQEIVQLLLDQGSNDYDYSMTGAARNGHLDVIQLLLNRGATDFDHALVEAARNGHLEVVQLLLDKGATDYDNALVEAARKGHLEVVQLLLLQVDVYK